jgi:hypothetical protein
MARTPTSSAARGGRVSTGKVGRPSLGGKGRPSVAGKTTAKGPRRSSGGKAPGTYRTRTKFARKRAFPAHVLTVLQQVQETARRTAISQAQSHCARSGDIKSRRIYLWRSCLFRVWYVLTRLRVFHNSNANIHRFEKSRIMWLPQH